MAHAAVVDDDGGGAALLSTDARAAAKMRDLQVGRGVVTTARSAIIECDYGDGFQMRSSFQLAAS